jgi:paraquat-inducible protein A
LLCPRKPASLARAWALVIAAMIFYVPANMLPVMLTISLGQVKSDTILSGVIYFMLDGSWHIALIIFVASILVPLVKLMVLIYLLLSVQFKWSWRLRDRTHLYHLTELVGRWSMVDIFAVTIMVALVRMGAIATVEAGPAGIYFAAVVVLTMLAAKCFDPRLMWDAVEERR